MKRSALGTALLLCLGGAVVVPTLASAEHALPREVRVSLHDTSGAEVAVARLTAVAEGTRVRVSARQLEPGQHGLHLHAVPSCDPATAFASAGGHYARAGQLRHGEHAGDLPPLLVAADGTARTDVVVDGFSLSELFDHEGRQGAALVVHGLRDNLANVPVRYRSPAGPPAGGPDQVTLDTGDSGPRIACGVVGSPVPVTAGAAAAGAAGASARMRTAAGADAGVVTVRQLAGRVEVRGQVTGLTPGFSGFHVHETGVCDGTTTPPFTSAGRHLDPSGEDHGEHDGDLPALRVRADGSASADLDSDELDVDELFDADGAAIIVHAGRDNAANIPVRYQSNATPGPGADRTTLDTGDSGDRFLCGVVQNGAGTYRPVEPRRLLDTRVTGGPLARGLVREVRVRPAEQTTTQLAMLTLTAVRPSADTVVTIGPAGTARPVGSSAPTRRGQVVATTVLVPVSPTGSVIVASTAATHLVVDLRGVFTAEAPVGGGRYTPVTPTRVAARSLRAGAPERVLLTGRGGLPAQDVSGVLLTLTATRPTTGGHLTVAASGGRTTGTSALNWSSGQTRAATVVAPVGSDGAVELRTSARSVDVLVDVVGWYTAAGRTGGRHVPLAPFQVRVTDGASGRTVDRLHLMPGEVRDVALAGVGGVPARGARAVVLAVTARGTARSHLVVHPAGTARPSTSNLNWAAGESLTTTVVTPLGAGGAVRLLNNAGHADVGVVVLGYVDAG